MDLIVGLLSFILLIFIFFSYSNFIGVACACEGLRKPSQ